MENRNVMYVYLKGNGKVITVKRTHSKNCVYGTTTFKTLDGKRL